MNNKNKDSESIYIKSIPIDDRLTIRLSSPTKAAFVALQKYKTYSYDGMISAYLDMYTKHNDGMSDSLISYCKATVADPELLSDIEQMFGNFKDSKIERVAVLSSKITTLEGQVTNLTSQIARILKQYPDIEVFSEFSNTNDTTDTNDTNDTTDTMSITIPVLSSSTFPSNINTFANSSLNSVLHTNLSPLLKNSHNKEQAFNYDYYVTNFNEIKAASHSAKLKHGHDILATVISKIELFTEELIILLNHHCDNAEMCDSLLPKNPNILYKYIETRLTFSSTKTDVSLFDIWSLTLTELHNVIELLEPYTVDPNFKLSASNMKSPQSALRTTLAKSYGFICNTTTQPFTTF